MAESKCYMCVQSILADRDDLNDYYIVSKSKIACGRCFLRVCYKCKSPIAINYYKVRIGSYQIKIRTSHTPINKTTNILVCNNCVEKYVNPNNIDPATGPKSEDLQQLFTL